MALVDINDMTTLRSASDSLATAQTAEQETQLKAVAYAINSAANTGENRTVFQGELMPEVEAELKSKGYELRPWGPIYPDRRILISWGPTEHEL